VLEVTRWSSRCRAKVRHGSSTTEVAIHLQPLDSTRRPTPLSADNVIGSGPCSWPRIVHDALSSAHALVQWRTDAWRIVDLGSTNGTWVDGARLPPWTPTPIAPTHRIVFGDVSAGRFQVPATGPSLFAVQVGSGRVARPDPPTLLRIGTSETGLQASVRQTPAGWRLEEDGDDAGLLARDGPILGGSWRVHLPGRMPTAQLVDAPRLSELTLTLSLGRFEEHVRAEVVGPDGWRCSWERAHWYVAWLLASELVSDTGASREGRGWIDALELTRMAGRKRKNDLDQYISKIRKDLTSAGVSYGSDIVQSRTGQRRLGLSPDRVVLHRE
jgi:pSer/pThr/pTyr-binding forkhead associated (FHA) protein